MVASPIEYHCVSLERPLKTEELNDFGCVGWTCFSVIAPLPGRTDWTYHFRREVPPPISAATLRSSRPTRGRLDRTGIQFHDLLGCYPDSPPVAVRRRRAEVGHGRG
jgi:hypothetical protein